VLRVCQSFRFVKRVRRELKPVDPRYHIDDSVSHYDVIDSSITLVNPQIMIRAYTTSVFPTAVPGSAGLNSRSIRCTSDDLAYGVTTAMSVLIYRRFGGSGPRYLSPSFRAACPFSPLSFSHSLSLSLFAALIIPIRSNSPFPPLFCCGGGGPERGNSLKKDRGSRPLDRSTKGRRTLRVHTRRLVVVSLFLSPHPFFPLSLPMLDDDSDYHNRRNSCTMTRCAHFTRARLEKERKNVKYRPPQLNACVRACVRRLHTRVSIRVDARGESREGGRKQRDHSRSFFFSLDRQAPKTISFATENT